MPHGVTPRQFQVLQETSEKVVVPKGTAIIRQGDVIDHVGLVVSGSTRASISGRRLTAASAMCPKSITEEKAGGNSGAWIGEMSFLENYWNKEHQNKAPVHKKGDNVADPAIINAVLDANAFESEENIIVPPKNTTQEAAGKTSEKVETTDSSAAEGNNKLLEPPVNRFTIVAATECILWQWDFDQVEQLMNRSGDFRGALSRAMTSAIVSKVINFTISKTTQLPTWSTWLDDWRYNAGASVNVKADMEEEEEEEEELEEEEEDASVPVL